MPKEILGALSVNTTEPSPTAQQVMSGLKRNVETILASDPQCSSFILVGGVGFGDFNPDSSDIDSWMVMTDLPPYERLQLIARLNGEFNSAKNQLVESSFLAENNFRHPPTFLTESESRGYRTAFAAKVGLPVYLGVFPTLAGQNRAGELCFTDEQLAQDLAYSCGVFQESLQNPPKSELEDKLRYTYKRASYFLRFELAYREGLYVPSQEMLLDACEEHLPEWREAIPTLKRLYRYSYEGGVEGIALLQFQETVRFAMQQNMTQFEEDGVIDSEKKKKGNIRTGLFWTLEKTRWDYILLNRDARSLRQSMGEGGQRSWGFSFSQIDQLMRQVSSHISNPGLDVEWSNFADQHRSGLAIIPDDELSLYYENVYQPTLIGFFDKILPYVGDLY